MNSEQQRNSGQPLSEQQHGLRAAVAAYACWGLLTLYWKLLGDFAPVDLVGWRIVCAAAVLSLVVLATGRVGAVGGLRGDRRTLGRVVLASLLLTGNWSTYVWAVVNDHVIETALGYFLAPLGTVALGVLVLGERLTPLKRVSIACALVAIVVLTATYGRLPWVAILLATTWIAYGYVKRGVRLDAVAGLAAELLVLVVPASVIVVLSVARDGGVASEASAREWLLLLGTGVITAVPLALFAYAAKRVPFTILGPANYLIPIINFLLGWLAFGEPLTIERLVGFGLVWLALVLVTADAIRDRAASRDLRGRHRGLTRLTEAPERLL
jgi:chloramphenicol-sensitive protein RarD